MFPLDELLYMRIEDERETFVLKQYELAERVGITPQTYNRLVRGKVADPSFWLIVEIARQLRVPLDSLLTRLGETIPEYLHDLDPGFSPAERITEPEAIPTSDAGENRPSKPRESSLPFDIVDFTQGLREVSLEAEVACGEPMDYSVKGETVMVPSDFAPSLDKHEYLVRARGDSMIEFGIEDGDYVVVEARPGGVAATGELVIAWYEPADKAQPGGITLKRWMRRGGRKILQGSSERDTFELKDGDIFELKGIVRRSFKMRYHPKISG